MTSLAHRVFVYGTLKKGLANHHLIENMLSSGRGKARFVALAKSVKKYPLIIATDFNIPFLLEQEGFGCEIVGQLFEVDDGMLEALDKLEGHPNYYTRLCTNVTITELADGCKQNDNKDSEQSAGIWAGNIVECQTYFMRNFHEELLSKKMYSDYDPNCGEFGEYVKPADRPPLSNWLPQIKK